MIEDFRLRVFVTAAELGSFTATAHELGISQPAVSQHIGGLEKYVGARLFMRTRGKRILTTTGERLLVHAKSILSSYADIENEFLTGGSLLIKGVLLDKEIRNVLISDGCFADIDAPEGTSADRYIDGTDMAIIPSFFNAHTHAAMTLMRGYADDLPLKNWLEDYIWPYEEKLTAQDIKEGSDLGTEEMVCSGSTFFSDMYFKIEQTIDSVDQSGMRAAIGITIMENHTKAEEDYKKDFVRNWIDPTHGRIQLTIAPHSVYTVGEQKLRKAAEFARKYNLKLHIHVAETEREVADCVREHGLTPVRYLDSIGFLGPDVIAAHCVYVNPKEWDILAKRGVTVANCPCSNMKLSSGRFPYELAVNSGCRICIGTDGPASNNNLEMMEEMKFAALLAKMNSSPTLVGAKEVFRWATKNGAEAFGINAGEIAVGKAADAVLLDLNNPRMRPCHNLISNVVYSANSSCVRGVFCNGRVIFKHGLKWTSHSQLMQEAREKKSA